MLARNLICYSLSLVLILIFSINNAFSQSQPNTFTQQLELFQVLNNTGNARINFRVNDHLSPYTANISAILASEPDQPEEYSIEISQDQILIQTFNFERETSMAVFANSFLLSDINFDGYLDFSVIIGSKEDGTSRRFFIFNADTQKFEITNLSKQLEKLAAYELYTDSEKREIYVEYLGPLTPSRDTYKVIDGKLVVTEKRKVVYHSNEDNTATITFTLKRRINDHIKTVRIWQTTKVKPKYEGIWTVSELEMIYPELLDE